MKNGRKPSEHWPRCKIELPLAMRGSPQANLSFGCGAAEPDQGRLTTRPAQDWIVRVAFHGAFGKTRAIAADARAAAAKATDPKAKATLLTIAGGYERCSV